MCVINANCQGLSRPIVASQECEAEPCSPDCWGFQLLSLSSRLPHTACVTRVLPSTKPLNSVLTSHSSSLQTLELPALSWWEGGSLCWASLWFSRFPVSISSHPLSLWFLRDLIQLHVTPLRDPHVHTPDPATSHCSLHEACTIRALPPVTPALMPAHTLLALLPPPRPTPAVHMLHPTLHPPRHVHRNDTLRPLHDPPAHPCVPVASLGSTCSS